MIYVVDEIVVAAEHTSDYLKALESVFLPPARQRGMELVACWHTPTCIGEDVTVITMFRCRDWAHWDQLRSDAVRDPRLYEWLDTQSRLRKSGVRRFYEPASFSPLG